MLYKAFQDVSDWPVEFIQVYLEDSLSVRAWVDDEMAKLFVSNVITIFPAASDLNDSNIKPRYSSPELIERVQEYVVDLVEYQINRETDQRNILQLLQVAVGFPRVRKLAATHLGSTYFLHFVN